MNTFRYELKSIVNQAFIYLSSGEYFLFNRLEEYMQEIQNKKKLLQTEINRIQSEMNSMKMQIPTEPLGCLDPKVLQQKVKSI